MSVALSIDVGFPAAGAVTVFTLSPTVVAVTAMSTAQVSRLSMSTIKSVSVIVVAPAAMFGTVPLNVQVPATFTNVTGPPTACMPAGITSERSMFAWLLPAAVFVTVKRIVLVAPTSMDAGEKDFARFIRAPTVSVSLPPVVAVGVWSGRMFVTVLV